MKIAIVSAGDVENSRRFDAEYYVNLKVRCSLCNTTFPKYDSLIEQRKKNHEQRHTRGKSYKGRSTGGGNNIIGKVEWLDVKESDK